MMKRFPCGWLAVLALAAPFFGQSAGNSVVGSWSGVVVSSACNADEAFNGAPDCAKQLAGAKLSLYDDTTRVMYQLNPQKAAQAHLGEAVTVRGRLKGETIEVASLKAMAIGLAVGQKAPGFAIKDQAGKIQTLDTLKGANGTVLLFFHSADW